MKFFNSKKLMAGLAIGFGIAAISSTALAAYVITGGSRTDTKDTLKPTEVEINNNVVNLTATLENAALLFEPVSPVTGNRVSTTTPGNWDLTLDLSIKAMNKTLLGDIDITTTVTESNTTISTYITAPTVKVAASKLGEGVKGEENYLTFNTQITLAWDWAGDYKTAGSIADYYNSKSVDEVPDAQLVQGLNEFKTAVANVTKYTVNITMAEPVTA